ncbi:DUF1835 domain-containing protein [Bernardetia sp. Wsw4-3y2]|uniref:DUF1835 domain-containing protein n=1 Tax=Bernardetia sp. Wsw4-3y2 TaxID=3127471 RepID=UPI0030CCCFD8
MKPQNYHILNGDSLKEQFPKSIQGKIIVAREALVDGNVEGESLEEFYETRATFISSHYAEYSKEDYFEKTVSEFEKIQAIPSEVDINLWFEDDLFCQVNFWFVVHLLNKNGQKNSIFLVRPKEHTQYGFGGLNESELISIYENRLSIGQNELNKIALLWEHYKNNDTEKLVQIAKELGENYAFMLPAIDAHLQRFPTSEEKLGRPKASLIQIMKDLKSEEFEPVFREFSKRESIYGFGDLQVQRLFDEVKSFFL